MTAEDHHSTPPRIPMRKDPALPLVMIAVGVALIALLGRVERDAQTRQPWAGAALVLDKAAESVALSSDAIPARVRRVDIMNYPTMGKLIEALRKSASGNALVKDLRLDEGEPVVFLDVPGDRLEPLLVSGRLPMPGAREVLAGDLAELDTFIMDGETFHIVGRLQRGVGGLTHAYVIPEDKALRRFFLSDDAKPAWLEPEGLHPRLEGVPDETPLVQAGAEAPVESTPEPLDVAREQRVSGAARTTPEIAWGVLLGLLLVAAGGAVGQVRLLGFLGRRHTGLLGPILAEIIARPRLLIGFHVLLYGLFFACMAAGVYYPVLNARVVSFVSGQFSEGSLSYIGAAYASESIARATLATFFQNYIFATLLCTFLPSLIVPFAGVLKNALSFGLVGFAMAPIWTGMSDTLVFHSITLTLELEAYIIASFAVSILPLRMIKGLFRGPFAEEWAGGLAVIFSGAVLAGIMLAGAAFYEATTLVLLR